MVICYSDLRKPLPLNLSVDLAHLELHANSGLWPLFPQQATPACPWPPCSSFSRLLLAHKNFPVVRETSASWTLSVLFHLPAALPSICSLESQPTDQAFPPSHALLALFFFTSLITMSHTRLCSVCLSRMSAPHGQGFFSHSPPRPWHPKQKQTHVRYLIKCAK